MTDEIRWFDTHWSRVGAVLACVMVATLPLVLLHWGSAAGSIHIVLIGYLLHQVEEHTGDRFRRFANTFVGHGREVLTLRATMLINVVGVWGGYLALILLTRYVDPGFGLIGAYAAIVNGLAHIAVTAVRRVYNPGFWTSLVFLVPAGAWAWVACSRANGLGLAAHAIGLGVAVLIHVAIIGWVRHAR